MTEEMGGTGQDIGWDGKGERRKGRERQERGYSPQTSIPGAATAATISSSSSLKDIMILPSEHKHNIIISSQFYNRAVSVL